MQVFCCEISYDLGCFEHDEDINTSLSATVEGVHQIKFETRGSIRTIETTSIGIGSDIIIPNQFNEAKTTKFQIIDPNGDVFTTVQDGVTYSTFCLTNKIAV